MTDPTNAKTVGDSSAESTDERAGGAGGGVRGGGRVGPVPARRVLSPARERMWVRRERLAVAAVMRLARLAVGEDVGEERARGQLAAAVLAIQAAGRAIREGHRE